VCQIKLEIIIRSYNNAKKEIKKNNKNIANENWTVKFDFWCEYSVTYFVGIWHCTRNTDKNKIPDDILFNDGFCRQLRYRQNIYLNTDELFQMCSLIFWMYNLTPNK